jgi:hypothetical protein
MNAKEMGQGRVEYALYLVVMAIVLAALVWTFARGIGKPAMVNGDYIPDLPLGGRYQFTRLEVLEVGSYAWSYEGVLADIEGNGHYKWYKINPTNDHVYDAPKNRCYIEADTTPMRLHLAASCEPQGSAQ